MKPMSNASGATTVTSGFYDRNVKDAFPVLETWKFETVAEAQEFLEQLQEACPLPVATDENGEPYHYTPIELTTDFFGPKWTRGFAGQCEMSIVDGVYTEAIYLSHPLVAVLVHEYAHLFQYREVLRDRAPRPRPHGKEFKAILQGVACIAEELLRQRFDMPVSEIAQPGVHPGMAEGVRRIVERRSS